jgi:hypothetical protein
MVSNEHLIASNGHRGASMAAIAGRVGINQSTVSCAFSRPWLVSPDTAEEVYEAAADLGYVHPRHAGIDPGIECHRTRALWWFLTYKREAELLTLKHRNGDV